MDAYTPKVKVRNFSSDNTVSSKAWNVGFQPPFALINPSRPPATTVVTGAPLVAHAPSVIPRRGVSNTVVQQPSVFTAGAGAVCRKRKSAHFTFTDTRPRSKRAPKPTLAILEYREQMRGGDKASQLFTSSSSSATSSSASPSPDERPRSKPRTHHSPRRRRRPKRKLSDPRKHMPDMEAKYDSKPFADTKPLIRKSYAVVGSAAAPRIVGTNPIVIDNASTDTTTTSRSYPKRIRLRAICTPAPRMIVLQQMQFTPLCSSCNGDANDEVLRRCDGVCGAWYHTACSSLSEVQEPSAACPRWFCSFACQSEPTACVFSSAAAVRAIRALEPVFTRIDTVNGTIEVVDTPVEQTVSRKLDYSKQTCPLLRGLSSCVTRAIAEPSLACISCIERGYVCDGQYPCGHCVDTKCIYEGYLYSSEYANVIQSLSSSKPSHPHSVLADDCRKTQASADEAVCVLCQVGESTDDNPIVFCDGHACTLAYHANCYDVEKLPQFNWYCRVQCARTDARHEEEQRMIDGDAVERQLWLKSRLKCSSKPTLNNAHVDHIGRAFDAYHCPTKLLYSLHHLMPSTLPSSSSPAAALPATFPIIAVDNDVIDYDKSIDDLQRILTVQHDRNASYRRCLLQSVVPCVSTYGRVCDDVMLATPPSDEVITIDTTPIPQAPDVYESTQLIMDDAHPCKTPTDTIAKRKSSSSSASSSSRRVYKNKPKVHHLDKVCRSCGVTESFCWREGFSCTLCNACGVRLYRHKLVCPRCFYVPRATDIAGDRRLCTQCCNGVYVRAQHMNASDSSSESESGNAPPPPPQTPPPLVQQEKRSVGGLCVVPPMQKPITSSQPSLSVGSASSDHETEHTPSSPRVVNVSWPDPVTHVDTESKAEDSIAPVTPLPSPSPPPPSSSSAMLRALPPVAYANEDVDTDEFRLASHVCSECRVRNEGWYASYDGIVTSENIHNSRLKLGWSVYESSDLKYPCPWCPMRFRSADQVLVHFRTQHLAEMLLYCIDCGSQFALQQDLDRHRKQHRRGRAPKAYLCPFCDTAFPDNQLYVQHLLITHYHDEQQATRYKCRYCLKRYQTPEARTDHENDHLGLWYVCAARGCQRQCRKHHHLNRHMRKDHGMVIAGDCDGGAGDDADDVASTFTVAPPPPLPTPAPATSATVVVTTVPGVAAVPVAATGV